MGYKVTLLGRARLERRLNAIPKATKDFVKKDMEQIAQQIVDRMKAIVPVDTGALRDSIGWTWGRPPKGSTAFAVAKNTLGSEMTLTIYAGNEATLVRSANGRRPYLQKAWIVEFGTSRTPAQPYFRPVWKTERKRVKGKVRSSVKKSVKATQ